MKVWELDRIHFAARLVIDDMEELGITKFETVWLSRYELVTRCGAPCLLSNKYCVSKPVSDILKPDNEQPPEATLTTRLRFVNDLEAMAKEIKGPAAALREERLAEKKEEAAACKEAMKRVDHFIASYPK